MNYKNLYRLLTLALAVFIIPFFFLHTGIAWAQPKPDKSKFTAVVTDSQGVETELKHVIFYWEEKINETSFVPHELVYLPVKQGSATINVKFEKIKHVDVKPGADKGATAVSITLTDGKTKEFTLALDGKLKGETDFGEIELPAHGIKKVVFK